MRPPTPEPPRRWDHGAASRAVLPGSSVAVRSCLACRRQAKTQDPRPVNPLWACPSDTARRYLQTCRRYHRYHPDSPTIVRAAPVSALLVSLLCRARCPERPDANLTCLESHNRPVDTEICSAAPLALRKQHGLDTRCNQRLRDSGCAVAGSVFPSCFMQSIRPPYSVVSRRIETVAAPLAPGVGPHVDICT